MSQKNAKIIVFLFLKRPEEIVSLKMIANLVYQLTRNLKKEKTTCDNVLRLVDAPYHTSDESENNEVCPDCGRPAYEGKFNEFICILLHLFEIIYTFVLIVKKTFIA